MRHNELGLRMIGIVLGVGCALACTPEGDAVGRALFINAANQALTNEINSNQSYSAQCSQCGVVFSWQGRNTSPRCSNCGNINSVSYPN